MDFGALREWPLGLGLWGAMALGAWVLDGLLLIRENIRENRIKNGIREFGQEKSPTDFDPDFAEF